MEDTIFALSTPFMQGGIAIIRMSGPLAKQTLEHIFRGKKSGLITRRLSFGTIFDGDNAIDEVMAVFLPAPYTYTREDMAEIQCHGGPAVIEAILQVLSRAPGLRPAAPGEFTRRAFENGRIDLSEAEAVMDIISAQSQSAARASLHQLQGSVSRKIRDIIIKLTDTIAAAEAVMDYPEDDWELEAVEDALVGLEQVQKEIARMRASYQGGRIAKNGVRCAIVGRPNVGKSSLLNAAAGFERAIVDAQAGTTRDVLEEPVSIDGTLIRLFDTAGLRPEATGVERRGMDLGLKNLWAADVALLVLDASQPITDADKRAVEEVGEIPCVTALNKSDLPPCLTREQVQAMLPTATVISCSAKMGDHIQDILRAVIQKSGGGLVENDAITNARHAEALRRAEESVEKTIQATREGMPFDVAAVDARAALHALGEITGDQVDEDVIDSIFANFCLGK